MRFSPGFIRRISAGIVVPATITPVANASSTANSASYTFTSQNLGPASAGRYIAVAAGGGVGADGSGFAISSVTVGGIAAEIVAERLFGVSGSTAITAIAIAAVPDGTTGNIVVTFGASVQNCWMAAYALTGLMTDEAAAVASAGADDPSISIDCDGGDVILAAASGRNGAGTTSWTGLTEGSDVGLESLTTGSSAYGAFDEAQVGLNVQSTFSVGAGAALCAVAFRAAGGNPLGRGFAMMGDSITALYLTGTTWPELTGNPRAANFGIPSNNTTQMLARTDAMLATNPGALFLLGGVNDLTTGVSTATGISNIQGIIGKCQALSIPIYVQAILRVVPPYANEASFNSAINAKNTAFQDAVEAYGGDGVYWLNWRDELISSDFQSIDGIHLKLSGAQKWAAFLEDYFALYP